MRYRRSLFNRGFVWLTRFRYRKGYGIQSPSAFHFMNHVIFESTPYYEYERLKEIYQTLRAYEPKWVLPRKRYELIFRIANEIKASEIIEIGTHTGLGSIYASAARKAAHCHILNEYPIKNEKVPHILAEIPAPVRIKSGDIPQLLLEGWATSVKDSRKLILFNSEFFPATEHPRIIRCLLERVQPGDCILLSGLQQSKELRRLWKRCTVHSPAGLSFDLYEVGILFFKPSLPQKCYLINY